MRNSGVGLVWVVFPDAASLYPGYGLGVLGLSICGFACRWAGLFSCVNWLLCLDFVLEVRNCEACN